MKRRIDGEMVKGYPDLLILALLNNGDPLHGYLIRQQLIDISNHVLHPSFGRIYPLLAEMEKKSWIKSRTELVGRRRERKVYRMTAKGRTELTRRVKKWQLFSAGIDRLLKTRGCT